MQDPEELNRDEYNWLPKPILGLALIIYGAVTDSYKDPIDPNVYYEFGKSKIEGGKNVLLPTNKNQVHDFVNEQMKKTGRFN